MALQNVVGGETVFAWSNVSVFYNANAGRYHLCIKVYNKINVIIEIYI